MEDGIKPSEIESTLQELFEKEKQSNKVRASLFNLIIYTEGDERESYLKDLTKSLIKEFPCRIILIKESKKEGDFIHTKVSSLQPDGGEGSFFCEFIEFEVSKSYKQRISYLVTPHFIPNLPIYLLFCKDPCAEDSPHSLGLEDFPTRVIFDSECTDDMHGFAESIQQVVKNKTSAGDLNWARFSSWRKLFVKVYSNQKKLAMLLSATSVKICYNTHETETFHHNKIQATYMAGWLAAKLGWRYETVLCVDGVITVTYKSEHGSHSIEIAGAPPRKGLPPGRITSIEVENNGETTSFLREEEHSHLVKIDHHFKERCEIPVLYPLSKEGMGTSITKEIYSRTTSEDFLAVLDVISNWKTGIICQ